MKKTGILALLLAGIMTASVCAVAAQAEETPKADSQAEITAEEETTRRKKPERSRAEKQITDEETETAEKVKPCKGRKAKTEAAEPEGVIGKDAAKEAALADAGVEAEGHVRAKYQEKDGESTYTVRFKADGQVYKLKIDAKTGSQRASPQKPKNPCAQADRDPDAHRGPADRTKRTPRRTRSRTRNAAAR